MAGKSDVISIKNSNHQTMASLFFRLGRVTLAGLLVCGCSASGPIFSEAPPPGKTDALVYVYRPDAMFYSGIQSHFYLDDVNIVSLNKNGYSWFLVPAGAYSFKQHWSGMKAQSQTISFPAEFHSGQKKFFRLNIGIAGTGYKSVTHGWVVTEVPEAQALQEMRELRFQAPFEIDKLNTKRMK